MKTLLALITLCCLTSAHATDITLTPAQVSTVCSANGGCGAAPPIPPTNCPPGEHWQGNICVPDVTPPSTGCAGPGGKVINMEFPWINPVRQYTGSMGVNDVVVVKFTTGGKSSANNNLPKINGAEWGSAPSTRRAVLSAAPCDFSAQTWQGASSDSYSPSVPFALGTGYNYGYYPILELNSTYYFNVKTLPNGSCSASGICDMFFELILPAGL